MPGLTLWMKPNSRMEDMTERFGEAQSLMLHGPGYKRTVLVTGRGVLLGYVGFPEYPVKCIETGSRPIVVEGRIYNKAAKALESELLDLREEAFGDPQKLERTLARWVLGAHGEYIVIFVDPESPEVVVFTDPVLGRLPLYQYSDDTCLLMSRECKFIQKLKPNPTFDRLGVAEYLFMGHSIGNRTLYTGVSHHPGAMLLRSRVEEDAIRTRTCSLFTLNFEDKDTSHRSPREHARTLVDLFIPACRDIGASSEGSPRVLCLSGGKDSRATAAGLARAGVEFLAVSHRDSWKRHTRDSAIAEQIAEKLGVPWHLLELGAPGQRDMDRVTWMKDGLNDTGNARVLQFHDMIVDRWGSGALQLSGLCANALHDVRYQTRGDRLDHLIDAISRAARIPAKQVEPVMRLDPGTLRAELRRTLLEYPEESPVHKGLHFNMYARVRNWEFDGEDRARFFSWETTPFASFPFFRECVRLPDERKAYFKVCAAFLNELSPDCARLVDADHNAVPGTWSYRLKLMGENRIFRLPEPVKNVLRPILRAGRGATRYAVPPEQRQYIESLFNSEDGLDELMSPDAVRRMLTELSAKGFCFFWTVLTLRRLWKESPAGMS